MPKNIVNNRINYQNAHGRIIQHDLFLNQGVRSGDSPTFNNLLLTGDARIRGNLYVEGNASLLDTDVVEFKDNIILVNNQESGAGVTLHQSGFEIDRGSLETFRVVYNELNSRVEVGVISNLQPIVLRESIPLENGVMVWDNSTKVIKSSNDITIPILLSNTTNSTSSTSGALKINGGIGIKKDIYVDGRMYLTNTAVIYNEPSTDTLNINSIQDINLTPIGKIVIPYDKPIVFGTTSQGNSIVTNSLTNNLSISSSGDINLTPSSGKKINVPNQIPITFSTQNEKVYTDSSNNMVIAGSQDIYLYPNNGAGGGGKKVFVPVDTPIVFSNVNQSILANINNDLTINANNNIFINPGNGLDVKIPIDAGIRFGNDYQRISANSNSDLQIDSTGDLYLRPSSGKSIKVPVNIPVTFSTSGQYITGDSNGSLKFSATNIIVESVMYINNTSNSINSSTGSIYTDGGLGVKKDIISEGSIKVNSSNANSLQINGVVSVFNVDASTNKVSITSGSNGGLELNNSSMITSRNLIQLKSGYDSMNGYTIGRGTSTMNDGRTLSVNLPNYVDYSNSGARAKFSITSNMTELFSIESETGNISSVGTFGLSSTEDSISPTTGSVVIQGGIGIVKSIYTSGKYISSVDSINAFQIKDASSSNLFNIDTVTQNLTVNQLRSTFNSLDTNAFKITNNTNTVLNIDTLTDTLSLSLNIVNSNTSDSTDISSGSVILSGGMSINKKLTVGGISSFNSGINLVNNNISNVANPVNAQDAATKSYVDLIKQGLYVKDSVNVATTTDGNLSTYFIAGNSVDNYTLQLNDRILIKDQINSIENGIYKITNGTPLRTDDLSLSSSASGIFVFVKSGDINNSLGWICNTNAPNDIIGTNSISFTEFTGLGQVQVGTALSKNFNEINVNVDDSSLEVDTGTNALRIKNTAVGTGLTGGSGSVLQTTTDQSHVTKLGTINTGVWNGTSIQVGYGGTGRTTFNSGNILFGNGTSPINTDTKLFYNNTNTRLGLGTNAPTKDFEIKSTNTISLLLNADSEANNSIGKPEIIFTYNGGLNNSYIGMTRNYNEYANDIYPNSLVLNTDAYIQFATANISRLTINPSGLIGINTSAPTSTLSVNGTFDVNNTTQFLATTTSNSYTSGAVILSGGLSINCSTNSSSITNGGALSIAGGLSIGKDIYIGGNLINVNSNTFGNVLIIDTIVSSNLSSGSLILNGGITIKCSTNSSSVTNGGGLTIAGGASINKDMYIGNNLYVKSDTFLNNLYFTSSLTDNYIESPNVSRTTNSFLPTHFTQYNNTAENILTIANSGIVLNNNHSLQIGGTLNSLHGYTLNYTSSNLSILPNGINYNINFGTIGNYTNINIYGNNGEIAYNSSISNLQLTKTNITLINGTSSSIVLTTPNTSGSFIQASGGNTTLNIGGNSTGGQLTTILSNNVGDSKITFVPSNITSSSLTLTNNIYSTFNGPITLKDRTEYSGNALHQTINNTSGNSVWYYCGYITGYCEVDFNNGIDTVNAINGSSGLKVVVSVYDTTCVSSHSHYGSLMYNSTQKPICYIYNDTFNDYTLFVKVAPFSQTNINVTSLTYTKFVILEEGNSGVPNGVYSGYNGGWTEEYKSNTVSTLQYTTGDLTVEGSTLNICDNLPIIGYVSDNTTSSRDVGLLFQRYQTENDSGLGDIVDTNASPIFIDSIPNQSLIVVLDQIKFSTLANATDDYYIGWWIKVSSGSNINQVRKIISYNGTQRVATLNSPFTSQNPNNGDSVKFYNNTYVANYYDEVNDTFVLGYTNNDTSTNLTINNNANLRIKGLYASDTTSSTNITSGGLYLLGGISINNTNNASSATNGGTITTNGGVGINKDLIVGSKIGIGNSGFSLEESIHIRKSSSTIRVENDTGSYSYIDFVENATNNRYGILLDSSTNDFSLTNTNSAQTPSVSNKALTINNLGYVGINATSNVVSPLGINVNSFISTNSTTGYLGIVGGTSNTNNGTIGSRVILNANSQVGNISSGCLNLYAGNVSSGNVSIFTGSGSDIERVQVNNNGSVSILSTKFSDSITTGALQVFGGMSIQSTQNASSITSGGALTVGGGISISKDLYIGGDIFINGSFTASGAVTSPTIVFDSFTNCALVEYFNNNLSVSGSLGVLTFGFSVTPTNSSENCEVEIVLPGRTNSFIKRFEVISNVSGYTDDTSVIPLFNVLGCGVVGTTHLLVKFQSASTNTHFFQVQCTYILA